MSKSPYDAQYSMMLDRSVAAKATMMARALGFRGLSDLIRTLLLKWMAWAETRPDLRADIDRWRESMKFYSISDTRIPEKFEDYEPDDEPAEDS